MASPLNSITPNPTDQVVVMREHLEEWETIMRWAHGHFAALDLADNYRAGRPTMNKSSRLNILSLRAQTRMQGYLNDGTDDISTEQLILPD